MIARREFVLGAAAAGLMMQPRLGHAMESQPATKDFARIQALAKRTLGWEPQALEREIGNTLALFETSCLGGNRCFETKVGSAFVGASIRLEHLQLARAFEHREQGALDSAARRYVAFEYLHNRMRRCFFKKEWQADLYGLALGEFGFATCAAIHLGAEKEARWLGREYARHVDAGYKCPYTLDYDFLRVCRWITATYLSTSAANSSLTGLYQNLANVVTAPESAAELLDAVYTIRTEKAYKRIVLEDES